MHIIPHPALAAAAAYFLTCYSNSSPLPWQTRDSNTTYSQPSQLANQYPQRYHFHVVTSHSLSEFCLSNRGGSAERARGDASRQRRLLTQM